MKQNMIAIVIVCLLVGAVSGYGAGYITYEPKIKNYEDQVNSLTSEVSRLKSTISSQQGQILTLESEKARLQSDLAEAQRKITTYETQISSLESQVSALQSQILTLQSQVGSLQSRLNKILGITVTQHYEWNYEAWTWKWDLPIPLSLYVEYWERSRPSSVASYIDMAKDPKDDYYIDQMFQRINEAAIKSGFTEIEKVNFVIAFVQSLPYTVDIVTTPYDEYPRYPIETLFDRGGDCEDTSILVAALLDRMGYDVALLWLKNAKHMAVGVSIAAYGYYYEYDDKRYFYLETTGEGWKIGQMPDLTDTRAYVYPLHP